MIYASSHVTTTTYCTRPHTFGLLFNMTSHTKSLMHMHNVDDLQQLKCSSHSSLGMTLRVLTTNTVSERVLWNTPVPWLQNTPASSEWSQSWPLCREFLLHCRREFSEPWHLTLSSRILPTPLPNCDPATALAPNVELRYLITCR